MLTWWQFPKHLRRDLADVVIFIIWTLVRS